MNNVLFRDLIKKTALTEFFPGNTKLAQELVDSPVFEVPYKLNEGVDNELWRELWGPDLALRLPYSTMKIKLLELDGTKSSIWHVVKVRSEYITLITYLEYADGKKLIELREIKITAVVESGTKGKDLDVDVRSGIFRAITINLATGKKAMEMKDTPMYMNGALATPEMEKLFIDASTMHLTWLTHLSYCIAYPQNKLVRVKPDKPGKSVQWTEARSYFTILPMKAIQAMQHGASKEQTQEIIQRCAHERRAHPRRLTAPRFFQGQTGQSRVVWVKESWVGPQEWRNKSDGHIYKIQD